MDLYVFHNKNYYANIDVILIMISVSVEKTYLFTTHILINYDTIISDVTP